MVRSSPSLRLFSSSNMTTAAAITMGIAMASAVLGSSFPIPLFPPPSVPHPTSVSFVADGTSITAPCPSLFSVPTPPSPVSYISASLIASKAEYSTATLPELPLPLPQSMNCGVFFHWMKMADHSSAVPSFPSAPPSIMMTSLPVGDGLAPES